MEKQVFTQTHIDKLREMYSTVTSVDPVSFNDRMDAILKKMTTDQVVQIARAGIRFVSNSAYFEAKHRGVTIEGWRAAI